MNISSISLRLVVFPSNLFHSEWLRRSLDIFDIYALAAAAYKISIFTSSTSSLRIIFFPLLLLWRGFSVLLALCIIYELCSVRMWRCRTHSWNAGARLLRLAMHGVVLTNGCGIKSRPIPHRHIYLYM